MLRSIQPKRKLKKFVLKSTPMFGNIVSHANNKTGRKFKQNVQTHKIFIAEQNRFVYIKGPVSKIRSIIKNKQLDLLK